MSKQVQLAIYRSLKFLIHTADHVELDARDYKAGGTIVSEVLGLFITGKRHFTVSVTAKPSGKAIQGVLTIHTQLAGPDSMMHTFTHTGDLNELLKASDLSHRLYAFICQQTGVRAAVLRKSLLKPDVSDKLDDLFKSLHFVISKGANEAVLSLEKRSRRGFYVTFTKKVHGYRDTVINARRVETNFYEDITYKNVYGMFKTAYKSPYGFLGVVEQFYV